MDDFILYVANTVSPAPWSVRTRHMLLHVGTCTWLSLTQAAHHYCAFLLCYDVRVNYFTNFKTRWMFCRNETCIFLHDMTIHDCMYRYSCVIDKNAKCSLWLFLPILRMSKFAQDNIEDERIASSSHSSARWLDERATRRLLDHRDADNCVTERIPSFKCTAIKSMYLYISFSEPIMVNWLRLRTICLRH